MAIIRIDSNENEKNLIYKSVRICYGTNEEKVFSTGNFVKDWYDMKKFMIQQLSDTEPFFIYSSSVDHFIMDGAPYDSAYLKFDENEKPFLSYTYEDDNHIELFVPEGTKPTWEELKEMCK